MFLNNNKGVSLTELILSSILVGIIMLGVAAFTFAIKDMQDNTAKAAILSVELAGAITKIEQDANRTIGDSSGSPNDLTSYGVYTFNDGTVKQICFRHDTLSTPGNYTDDIWACYGHDENNDIIHCEVDAVDMPISDCNIYTTDIEPIISILSGGSYEDFFSIDYGASSDTLEYIQIKLITVPDNSKAPHPSNNPKYELSTRISPPGHTK